MVSAFTRIVYDKVRVCYKLRSPVSERKQGGCVSYLVHKARLPDPRLAQDNNVTLFYTGHYSVQQGKIVALPDLHW